MRTDWTLKAITDALQVNYGDLHAAARTCGVSPSFLFQWMKDDAEVLKAVEEAQRVGYAGLESAAINRGVHGVDKAVYYKGQVAGYEKQYSDMLLVKLMEARLPEYSKKQDAGNTFNGPTQINIMPRANNYEEWLAMKDATLKPKALPAPAEQIVDASYHEVTGMDALRGLL